MFICSSGPPVPAGRSHRCTPLPSALPASARRKAARSAHQCLQEGVPALCCPQSRVQRLPYSFIIAPTPSLHPLSPHFPGLRHPRQPPAPGARSRAASSCLPKYTQQLVSPVFTLMLNFSQKAATQYLYILSGRQFPGRRAPGMPLPVHGELRLCLPISGLWDGGGSEVGSANIHGWVNLWALCNLVAVLRGSARDPGGGTCSLQPLHQSSLCPRAPSPACVCGVGARTHFHVLADALLLPCPRQSQPREPG